MKSISKKWLSSDNFIAQVLGAMTHKGCWILTLFFLLSVINLIYSYIVFHNSSMLLQMLSLSSGVLLAFSTCKTLTSLYNLRKNEIGITWCQISILIVIGVWIVGTILILNIQMNEKNTLVFGVVGGVFAWVFQDRVKGALAFIHLRLHHLLSIDDWIKVPEFNVDGEVKSISLTTVTIYNWDTTTSTIPISALQSNHFINLQKMAVGKTYGRLMTKKIILDTVPIHPISAEEAERLRQNEEVMRYLPEEEIHEGVLNATLFRLYIYHWLMNHDHISQVPRLSVHWLDQSENGLSLLIYVHIMDGDFVEFEWQQSQILEHIIETIDWFGLRFYQRPSSFDKGSFKKEAKL